MIKNKTIDLKTEKDTQVIDITDTVVGFIGESGIMNGLVNVQTMHTTTGMLVNENEPLLWGDLEKHFAGVAEKGAGYSHDDMNIRTVNVCDDECANAHAHCRASHLMSNVTLNIIDGKLQVGRWQRIMFVELDRPRDRSYQMMVMGK